MIFNKIKKALVFAPHLDDETIAMGGTIVKMIKSKIDVKIVVIGGHLPPIYTKKQYEITKNEFSNSMSVLGVKKYKLLNIPATTFNEISISQFNKTLQCELDDYKPDVVFTPFPDRHIDHQVAFNSIMVITRPISKNSPKLLLAYETLSETHWNAPYIEKNFNPNYFINISDALNQKINAYKKYKSQINNSRSPKSLKSLASFRGSQNNCDYAESYVMIRCIDI